MRISRDKLILLGVAALYEAAERATAALLISREQRQGIADRDA